MGYGSTPEGGYNDLTRRYKASPTIENYLRLRRENPDAEIEVAIHGGIDQLFFMESELKKFGIEASDMASVFDADTAIIGKLSLYFMEKLIEARSLKKAGRTHLGRRGDVVPDKLIDWFITCALDATSWNDTLEVPRDLIVLIRERLGGSRPEYERNAKVAKRKVDAAMIAGQLIARGQTASFRDVAQYLRVSPSTVMRWFEPGEFERESRFYSSWWDSDGNFVAMSRGGLLREK